tara:strand:- start:190248 stop:190541 length:294 start_codon:yes stop_codon:yes gene_type:complete
MAGQGSARPRIFKEKNREILMEKKYLKTEQIVPGKGMSYTMYEIQGEDEILRMLTAIPDTGEVSTYPKPPVKKLFAPERCAASSEEEFEEFWQQGAK